MLEVLDRPSEGIEAKEGRRLIPVGIDRVPTPDGIVQIIRAKDENGKDVAVVLDVDELPLEMTLGDNNPRREGGALSRLAKNPVAKFVGGISGLAASALGVAACSPGTDSHSGNNSDLTYSTHSGALTTAQMMGNIQGQPAPWTDWGDTPGNFGEIDGKKVIFIGSNYDGTTPDWSSDVSYIECDQLSQCFDATATRQTVEGPIDDIGFKLAGPFYGAKIFLDKNGKYRFQVQPAGNGTYEGDIVKNPATGKLSATNMVFVEPPMVGGSFYIDGTNGNIPHTIYGLDKFATDRNLHTGEEKNLPEAAWGTFDSHSCGLPTLDGNLAIASKLTTISGVKHCSLVMGKTLEEALTSAAAIVSLNSQATGGVKRLGNPRLVTDTDGSGILIYSSTNGSPGNFGGNPLTKVWYALIPKPATPIDTDTTGGDTTDAPDAGTLPDTPTVTDTGTGEPDVAVEPDVPTAEEVADAIAEDVEAVQDAFEDIGLDPGDIQEIFDAAPEVEADTEADAANAEPPPEDIPETAPDVPPTPDIPPEPDIPPAPDTAPTPDTTSQNFIDNFKVAGNCQLTYAPTTQGGKDGATLDITGIATPDAPCVLHGLSNDKQITITLTNAKDGKIKISCVAFPGNDTECEPGLYTKPLVKELGAGTKLKIEGVVMGSEASEFYGMPMGELTDENGEIRKIFEVWNAKGEKPVTVNGQNFTFEVDGDGVVYWVNAKTGEKTEINPFEEFPKPAEGSGIDISAQQFDAMSAESGGADAATGPDATITAPPKGGEGGCQGAPGSVPGNPEIPAGALLVLTALALYFSRRRQEMSQ